MTFEQLLYFCEANKYHSFTKAAEALFVSQSTISMSISSLEKELGIELFKRSKKGLSLTIHGEYVLKCADTILSETANIRNYSQEYANMLSGIIKIGAAQLFNESIMPKVIAEFSHTMPDLQIKLCEYNNLSVIDSVYRRQINLGIIGYLEEQSNKIQAMLQEKNLSPEFLFTCHLKCYAHQKCSINHSQTLSLADLAPYKIIVHEFSGHSLGNYLKAQGIKVIEVNNYSVITRLLHQQDFMAIIPELYDFGNPATADIQSYEQTFFVENIYYSIVRSNKENITLAEKNLILLIKQAFQSN